MLGAGLKCRVPTWSGWHLPLLPASWSSPGAPTELGTCPKHPRGRAREVDASKGGTRWRCGSSLAEGTALPPGWCPRVPNLFEEATWRTKQTRFWVLSPSGKLPWQPCQGLGAAARSPRAGPGRGGGDETSGHVGDTRENRALLRGERAGCRQPKPQSCCKPRYELLPGPGCVGSQSLSRGQPLSVPSLALLAWGAAGFGGQEPLAFGAGFFFPSRFPGTLWLTLTSWVARCY